MKQVHFIVNPVAGKGDNAFNEDFIAEYFGKEAYNLTIKISKYKGHATLLAKRSVESGADIIVACGGDGTINEVASCLVHTDVLLGIIPIGSGNGLAESLKISRKVKKAFNVIRNGKTGSIDVATLNGKPFFSNMGIGFDARVISNYNASRKRRFSAYFRAVIKSIREFKYGDMIRVEMNGTSFKTKPFMFFVSNSSVMGYDISLTRMASLQDGLLDVIVIENMGKAEILFMGLLLLLKVDHYLRKIKYHRTRELKIAFDEKPEGCLLQTDGELQILPPGEVHVKIHDRALKVLVP